MHCLGPNTPCRTYWLPQLSILLLPFLSALTVFCFSCLWYLPSSSSSGLPQTSHGCPECKVVWCWSLFLVGVIFCFHKMLDCFHPFVVAFVVSPVICSLICVSWSSHCFFLSVPHSFNSPQLLPLKYFVIFLTAAYLKQTVKKTNYIYVSICHFTSIYSAQIYWEYQKLIRVLCYGGQAVKRIWILFLITILNITTYQCW